MTALRRRNGIEAALAPHLKSRYRHARIWRGRFCILAPRKYCLWMCRRMPQLTKPWRPRAARAASRADQCGVAPCQRGGAEYGCGVGPADVAAGWLATGLWRRASGTDRGCFAPNTAIRFTVSRRQCLERLASLQSGHGACACLRLEATGMSHICRALTPACGGCRTLVRRWLHRFCAPMRKLTL